MLMEWMSQDSIPGKRITGINFFFPFCSFLILHSLSFLIIISLLSIIFLYLSFCYLLFPLSSHHSTSIPNFHSSFFFILSSSFTVIISHHLSVSLLLLSSNLPHPFLYFYFFLRSPSFLHFLLIKIHQHKHTSTSVKAVSSDRLARRLTQLGFPPSLTARGEREASSRCSSKDGVGGDGGIEHMSDTED